MAEIFHRLKESRIVPVECPKCKKAFEVEYNPSINGSFYHSITIDRRRILGASSVHMRSARSLKCPYCSYRFISKRDW